MDELLEQLAADVQAAYGLENYYLHHSEIYRRVSATQETIYVYSMEFFPEKHRGKQPADENPEGTAVVEIDFHTKQLYSLIFVHDVSYAKQTAFYPQNDREAVIDWVENRTGLVWGRQFSLDQASDNTYSFHATVDHIPVHPGGEIQIRFSGEKLVQFYVGGVFPKETQVNWEPFGLLPENVENIAFEQLRLVEFPVHQQKKWIPVYGVNEIFITNNKQVIPVDTGNHATFVEMHDVMTWKEKPSENESFLRQELHLNDAVTLEEALENRPDPDAKPITKAEQDSCRKTVQHFLRVVYPDDSGQWVLRKLRREHGYLIAELKDTEVGKQRMMTSKIQVFIDPITMKAVNYIDNKSFFDVCNDYAGSESAAVTKEAAFEKIRNDISLEPIYVYDKAQKVFVMCGRLDCEYGVEAVSGERILLDEFED